MHDIEDVTYRYIRRFHPFIVDPETYHWAFIRLDIAMQREFWHAIRPTMFRLLDWLETLRLRVARG